MAIFITDAPKCSANTFSNIENHKYSRQTHFLWLIICFGEKLFSHVNIACDEVVLEPQKLSKVRNGPGRTSGRKKSKNQSKISLQMTENNEIVQCIKLDTKIPREIGMSQFSSISCNFLMTA